MRPSWTVPTLVATTAIAVAGCGGPSAEERRVKQDAYERSAQRVCKTMTPPGFSAKRRPVTFDELRDYVVTADREIDAGARQLHTLRGTLGDAASDATAAFDERIDDAASASDRFLEALGPVPAQKASQDDADRISAAAARLRGAFAQLYRAARRAGLDRCGRGANRLSDTALFALYRDRRFTIRDEIVERLGELRGQGLTRRYAERNLQINVAYFRRYSRMQPPRALRALHVRDLRRESRHLRALRRVAALMANPTPANVSAAEREGARAAAIARSAAGIDRRIARILDAHLR